MGLRRTNQRLSAIQVPLGSTLCFLYFASGPATSMIGLCQEGKSSPDALRRSAGANLFLILPRACRSLGRGSYFRCEPSGLEKLNRRLAIW